MRIVVDINHPAHVHYFKYFIREMEKKGHTILVTVSDKDIARQLLDAYDIPYVLLGSYGKGIIRKILYLPVLDWRMLKAVRDFHPDLFIGFGSVRAAHAGWLMGKKSIILDDTEQAVLGQMLYKHFASAILTPAAFQTDFGKKQYRFQGTTDLLYLHPDRFKPNPDILKQLGLSPGEEFFIVRFTSWDAVHDAGHTGISDRTAFIRKMERYGRIFITAEDELPDSLKKYQITVSPEKIHDLMYYATLFVGESPTMATEAACLGTQSVLMDPEVIRKDGSHVNGVLKYLCGYGILWAYNNEKDILERVDALLKNPRLKQEGKEIRERIMADNRDAAGELMIFVEKCGIYE
ncbi:MAG: DUF354 domain-containing protein [Methanocorpusculum sp.]|nr:DUF354 domain-containing protein [Methanocorpusculum sp.]